MWEQVFSGAIISLYSLFSQSPGQKATIFPFFYFADLDFSCWHSSPDQQRSLLVCPGPGSGLCLSMLGIVAMFPLHFCWIRFDLMGLPARMDSKLALGQKHDVCGWLSGFFWIGKKKRKLKSPLEISTVLACVQRFMWRDWGQKTFASLLWHMRDLLRILSSSYTSAGALRHQSSEWNLATSKDVISNARNLFRGNWCLVLCSVLQLFTKVCQTLKYTLWEGWL